MGSSFAVMLLCQHGFAQKPQLLASGNGVCVGGWNPLACLGHRWVSPHGKSCVKLPCCAVSALPGCCSPGFGELLVWRGMAAASSQGEDVGVGSSHPACSELMETQHCPVCLWSSHHGLTLS